MIGTLGLHHRCVVGDRQHAKRENDNFSIKLNVKFDFASCRLSPGKVMLDPSVRLLETLDSGISTWSSLHKPF